MLTKEDFSNAAFENIDDYPTLSTLYKVKDPRLLQNIEAIATMLSMFSSQLEVAQAEPFDKTRDSTVLADAAMRGIVPKSVPTVLKLKVYNDSNAAVTLSKGRKLLDKNGRYLLIDSGVTINAKSTDYVTATQVYEVVKNHTISESKPFYEILIDLANDESTLCGLSVVDNLGNEYTYTDRYALSTNGDRVYHIEVDERQNFYIRFGYKGVVGVQPAKGQIFKIRALYTHGLVEDYLIDDQLGLEVNNSVNDAYLKITVAAVNVIGENPISTEMLRELAKYPSVYNKNAVYLGEFDYLIRNEFSELKFLSIWNESAEEIARVPSVDNMNCLFVATIGKDYSEKFLDYKPDLQPTEIFELTPFQQAVKKAINRADDSYRVRFFTPLLRETSMNVTATISTSYDTEVVKRQIRTAILSISGKEALSMRKGKAVPSYQKMYDQIKKTVPALAVGSADLKIAVEDTSSFSQYPEIWHYVADNSLEIKVLNENVTTGGWGVGF